jgi:hypothetical protein
MITLGHWLLLFFIILQPIRNQFPYFARGGSVLGVGYYKGFLRVAHYTLE